MQVRPMTKNPLKSMQDSLAHASKFDLHRSGGARSLTAVAFVAILLTTTYAHAGWSTVTCADGQEMCCWVEGGVESNCHEGACHTLAQEPDSEFTELDDPQKETGDEEVEETSGDDDMVFDQVEGRSLTVYSDSGQAFCIDFISQKIALGECPEILPEAEELPPSRVEEHGTKARVTDAYRNRTER